MTGRTFTTKDLQQLASLANLKLTATEIKQLTTDLNHVFTYFRVIDSFDVEHLTATNSVNQETNVTRADEVTKPLTGSTATGQTKQLHNNYFVVKSIL